jgi:hypothetical protein
MARLIRFAALSVARLTWLHKTLTATFLRGSPMFGDRLWLAFRAPRVWPKFWAFAYPVSGRPWGILRRWALRLYMVLLRVDLVLWRLRRQ